MKASRALLLTAMLVLQTFLAFGDGTVVPPDPIGEKAYRAGLWNQLIPPAIIVSGALVAVALAVMHKNKDRG